MELEGEVLAVALLVAEEDSVEELDWDVEAVGDEEREGEADPLVLEVALLVDVAERVEVAVCEIELVYEVEGVGLSLGDREVVDVYVAVLVGVTEDE